MDKRSLVMYLSGLVAAGAVVGLAASCSDQPRIKCTAGHGSFAAVYNGASPCMPVGEEIGVEAYNYPLPEKNNLDPNRGSLGFTPVGVAHERDLHPPPDYHDSNTAHKWYSLGDWLTPEPTADNFCTVKEPNDIEQDLRYIPPVPPGPDGGGGHDPVPSMYYKYHWTNVQFYNTPAFPGTQLVANLEYTRVDGLADGGKDTPCTGTARVVGLWPLVDCTADPLPDGGAPPSPIDETKCSPEPDNSKGRPLGSGISPDLKTKCHADLHWCVLQNEPR